MLKSSEKHKQPGSLYINDSVRNSQRTQRAFIKNDQSLYAVLGKQ